MLILVSVILFIVLLIGYVMEKDSSAKPRTYLERAKHIFERGTARERFYRSYEPAFVLNNQKTINKGIVHWVDSMMVSQGYVKYENFFYIKGKKTYYDELPLGNKLN